MSRALIGLLMFAGTVETLAAFNGHIGTPPAAIGVSK